MSWASITKTEPKAAAAASSTSGALTARAGLQLLVVDANAIIDGVKLEGIADRAVTIQEVLDEIKDKQSRQFLANLPYQLEVAEPTEDSIQAVTRFARATGDVAALSTVDIKLLALVHTLEVAAHGADHLAAHPNQPRMHTKASFAEQQLPGWGNVPNPEDWRAVDEANDADEAALLAASTSRIAQHVQQLTLDPTAPNSFLQDGAPTAAAAAGGSSAQGPAAPLTPEAVSGGGPRTAASPLTGPTAAAAAAAAGGRSSSAPQQQQDQEADGAAAESTAAADAGEAKEAGGAGEGADGWEVAASSKGAARHRKRKAVKRQQHQQAFEQEWEEHSQLMQQQQEEPEPEPEQQQQTHSSAAGAQQQPEQHQDQQQEEQDGDAAAAGAAADAGASRAAADATNEELLAEEHCVYTADDVDEQQQHAAAAAQQQQQAPLGSSNSSSGAAASAQQQQQQQQQRGGPGSRRWQSSVAIITGDFAMQNVLLQMGLRLLTKDGRRIARLTRYALRCSACFTVTRDPGRLFCPKCGNLSLDRVEVVVGADGAEYFGVTKRHILRGTRFSLPKPKGGRAADDLVLREDVFLLKVKALGKQAVKKKAGNDDDDSAAAAAAGGVDPFAPEYSADTWHVPSQQELALHRGLAAALQPAWKQNPNERKLTRSNRRG